MLHHIRPALAFFVLLSLLTGAVYPFLVTGLAQTLFADEANGSLIRVGDQLVGARDIGQSFTRPEYFWGRPSATAVHAYNPLASGGSNLGPSNPALVQAVQERIDMLKKADPGNPQPIPLDLVTTSASGLDPHISLAAAQYQARRVAQVRQRSLAEVEELIRQQAELPWWGLLGEPRVHVLRLNLALDRR